jgi:hypothetical protein
MAIDLVELGRKNLVRWSIFNQPYLPGWSKSQSTSSRRAALKKLSDTQGCLRIDRKLNQLANVTQDKATERVARADQKWISKQGFCGLKGKKK